MEIRASEFRTARAAIAARGEGTAIRLEGRFLVVTRETADRLAEAGVEFAYLGVRDGRVITVPVN